MPPSCQNRLFRAQFSSLCINSAKPAQPSSSRTSVLGPPHPLSGVSVFCTSARREGVATLCPPFSPALLPSQGNRGVCSEARIPTSRPPPARYTSCSRLGLGGELQPGCPLRGVNERTDGDNKTVQHCHLVAPSWVRGKSGLPAWEPGKPLHLLCQDGWSHAGQQGKPTPDPPACRRFVVFSTETRDFFHLPLKNSWQMFQPAFLQLHVWNEREGRPFLGLDGQMEEPCSPASRLCTFPFSLLSVCLAQEASVITGN